MLDEAKKSVESILSQRLSSPFYGTLIISWLIWNWKIIYLTIFISENKITGSKIDYIVSNYNDVNHVVWLPLASTVLLLVVLPVITNGAYWLDLIYNRWRVNRKNLIEGKQLLNIEQSIKLREQVVNIEKQYATMLSDKDAEIIQLKGIIEKHSMPELSSNPKKEDNENSDINSLVDKIKSNAKLSKAFKEIQEFVLHSYSGLLTESGITQDILTFYISNDIIERTAQDKYIWTSKGKKIFKIMSNELFNSSDELSK